MTNNPCFSEWIQDFNMPLLEGLDAWFVLPCLLLQISSDWACFYGGWGVIRIAGQCCVQVGLIPLSVLSEVSVLSFVLFSMCRRPDELDQEIMALVECS